jgi:hypothetical protein
MTQIPASNRRIRYHLLARDGLQTIGQHKYRSLNIILIIVYKAYINAYFVSIYLLESSFYNRRHVGLRIRNVIKWRNELFLVLRQPKVFALSSDLLPTTTTPTSTCHERNKGRISQRAQCGEKNQGGQRSHQQPPARLAVKNTSKRLTIRNPV